MWWNHNLYLSRDLLVTAFLSSREQLKAWKGSLCISAPVTIDNLLRDGRWNAELEAGHTISLYLGSELGLKPSFNLKFMLKSKTEVNLSFSL